MDCIKLKQVLGQLKTERKNVETVWQLITRFVVPFRDDFYREFYNEMSVQWRNRGKYDDTAVVANSNLAANIHSALTNNIVRWFDLLFRDEQLNKVTEVKVWLEDCVQRIWRALQESNFDLEANEVYLDLTAYGQGVLTEEVVEKPDGSLDELKFAALPLHECWYQVDTDGKIFQLFREHDWTPSQMAEKFGLEALPDHIRKKAMTVAGVTQREKVIYCIYRRENVGEIDTYTVMAPEARPFGAKYFLLSTGERLGPEDGYYEMPAFLPKWRKAAGSKFGHSQAMICLDDILTLNQLVMLILTAGEKVLDPAILTTIRGVYGDMDITPGGVTVVQNTEAIKAFESGARFDVSGMTKKELQESINRCFFMDQLQLKESPAMTATEVNVRYQLMQRLLGPTLGRLQSDFLDPLIQRTFMILFRYRLLPEVPDMLKGRMGNLDIEYLGSMARSQRLDEVQAIERWIGNIAGMSEMFPNAKDRVDEDQVTLLLGQSMGVPARAMKSDGAVKMVRDKRQQEMAQAAKMAQMEQAGNAMKAIGEGAGGLKAIEGGLGGGQEAGAGG